MDTLLETNDFDTQFEQVGWGILTLPEGGEHYFSKPHGSVRLSPDLRGRGNRFFVFDPERVESRTVLPREEDPDDDNLESKGWHELDGSSERVIYYRLLPDAAEKIH